MIMDDFIDLFMSEIKGTITGLTGEEPSLTKTTHEDISAVSSINPPVALVTVNVTGPTTGKLIFALPPEFATALVDQMMGGTGESKDSMDEDELDGTKEIISNIAGAMTTALGAQTALAKLNMSASDINFIGANEELNIEDYAQLVVFNFKTPTIENEMTLLIDKSVANALVPQNVDLGGTTQEAPMKSQTKLSSDEMKNMDLIREIKLPVTVRIGTKRMLLKDVINMDIGSVVELNQLANDPLDILVDNRVIAQGEVVIVDGNFGVQITHIGTKRDRLNQLKG